MRLTGMQIAIRHFMGTASVFSTISEIMIYAFHINYHFVLCDQYLADNLLGLES